MLRHGKRMPMQMQIADVLNQQTDEGIALLRAPAVALASFPDGSLHDVATGQSPARKGSPKTLSPGVVEAQQRDQLDQLLGVYVDTFRTLCRT
jgi:hypothetical protein